MKQTAAESSARHVQLQLQVLEVLKAAQVLESDIAAAIDIALLGSAEFDTLLGVLVNSRHLSDKILLRKLPQESHLRWTCTKGL